MKLSIKRFWATIGFVALLFVCLKIGRYLLADDTSSYTRIMMHELYESEENIDILFVGSSHVYRSLVPESADTIFDKYTFNAGTSSQELDGSLAIINEAIEYHDIEKVYLELYYGIAQMPRYKERNELTQTYIISDYMVPSLRKVKYLLEASTKDYYVNSFILARRNWEMIFDWRHVLETFKNKSTASYRNYEWERKDDDEEYYLDRGFVASTKQLDDFEEVQSEIIIENISPDWRQSLQQIVEVCKKKDIELVWFMAPMPDVTLSNVTYYEEYSNHIKEMADDYGIEYYDFNLCKYEYFDSSNNKLFQDKDHLNYDGAVQFTEVFASFFCGDISMDELFFDSYKEKMEIRTGF